MNPRVATSESLRKACIVRNLLRQGASFHAQLDVTNTFGWFFIQNQYLKGSAIVLPFIDPASSSAHISQ
jgi:hypothetical protein